MAKFDSYIICTSPRSGSTLLCKLLAATGVAGNPDSYFHRPSVSAWLAAFGMTDEGAPERDVLDAVFRAAVAKGRRETGVFGLRLQGGSLEFFLEKLAVLHPGLATDAGRIEAAFGRTQFVHLRRMDKVEQAVSRVKARQTGLWHVAPDGTELERTSPQRRPDYDVREIQAELEQLTAHDRDWDRWFEREGIDPVRITYEALSADPEGVLRTLLGHLGLDRDAANGVRPEVAKLADGTSREWAARFRADTEAG